MDNNEKKLYDVRVIPYVKYDKKVVNGKIVEDAVDTFSAEERANLSLKMPSMLWMNNGSFYLAEAPLLYKGESSIKGRLFYIFGKLTPEEQERYFDRSVIIQMDRPEEVVVYGKESKSLFGKCRKRSK